MSKSLMQVLLMAVLIFSPISVNCLQVSHLTAHERSIGELKINELLRNIIPQIDVSRPLYNIGSLIGRGGNVISPALGRAGQVSTAVGVVFVNIGTLLLTLSQLLSQQGAIGGNPNFLNDALSEYLVKANVQVKAEVPSTIPLSEVASRINSQPHIINSESTGSRTEEIRQNGQGTDSQSNQEKSANTQESTAAESPRSEENQSSASGASQPQLQPRNSQKQPSFSIEEAVVNPIVRDPRVSTQVTKSRKLTKKIQRWEEQSVSPIVRSPKTVSENN